MRKLTTVARYLSPRLNQSIGLHGALWRNTCTPRHHVTRYVRLHLFRLFTHPSLDCSLCHSDRSRCSHPILAATQEIPEDELQWYRYSYDLHADRRYVWSVTLMSFYRIVLIF